VKKKDFLIVRAEFLIREEDLVEFLDLLPGSETTTQALEFLRAKHIKISPKRWKDIRKKHTKGDWWL
jgi:hypothetical protein